MTFVLVHPYRYKNGNLEFLLIKRKGLSYNWQGVTGALEKDEEPIDCTKREILEETGYIPSFITQVYFPQIIIQEQKIKVISGGRHT